MNFSLVALATLHGPTLPITPGFGAIIRTIVHYAARSKHQGCCRSTCAIRFNSATSAIYCLTTRCSASMETKHRNSTVSMPKTKSQRHHIMASLLAWVQISQAVLLAKTTVQDLKQALLDDYLCKTAQESSFRKHFYVSPINIVNLGKILAVF